MKLLIVSAGNFFSTYGGGQVYVRNLVDALIDIGFSLIIATPAEPSNNINVYRGCPVVSFSLTGLIQNHDQIVSLLKEVKPDIVHAHGTKSVFAVSCNELDIPCIVTAHHGGILCPAGTLLDYRDRICRVRVEDRSCLPCVLKNIRFGFLAWYVLRILPSGVLLFAGRLFRHLPFLLYFTPVMTAAMAIKDKQEEWNDIVRYAAILVAPSRAIAESMMLNGAPPKMVRLLHHGTPLPEKMPLLSHAKPDITHGIRFFFVGRICHVKGVHVMLEAFSEIEGQHELHLVGGAGNSAEKRYLEKLKQRYGNNDRIIWHGTIDHDRLSDLIADFDVMIHPTICLEVYGLNIAETLALGKPVIATRCGGAEEQIRDQVNGLLVEPNNPNELRKAMERVIHDHKLLNNMNKSSPKYVISLKAHVKELIKLYRQCLEMS